MVLTQPLRMLNLTFIFDYTENFNFSLGHKSKLSKSHAR